MKKTDKKLEDFYLGVILALQIVACTHDQDTIAGDILLNVDANACLKVAKEHEWSDVAAFIERYIHNRREYQRFLEKTQKSEVR